MLEEILLYAIRFENCLPPVQNKNNTGWWPHYDLEYPDPDKKVIEGDVEVYYAVLEWLSQIPRYDQKVIYAYLHERPVEISSNVGTFVCCFF